MYVKGLAERLKAQFAEVSALDGTGRNVLEQLVRALLETGGAGAEGYEHGRDDNKPMRLSKEHKPVQPMEQSPCC